MRKPTKKHGVLCINGCTVLSQPVFTTQVNCGLLMVSGPTEKYPPRIIVVSSWKVSDKIARILIEDFGGPASRM